MQCSRTRCAGLAFWGNPTAHGWKIVSGHFCHRAVFERANPSNWWFPGGFSQTLWFPRGFLVVSLWFPFKRAPGPSKSSTHQLLRRSAIGSSTMSWLHLGYRGPVPGVDILRVAFSGVLFRSFCLSDFLSVFRALILSVLLFLLVCLFLLVYLFVARGEGTETRCSWDLRQLNPHG